MMRNYIVLAALLLAGTAIPRAHASSNCSQPAWPGTPCSGNGECVAGVCVCQDGWISGSDLHDEVGADCGIRAGSMQGLWFIGLVACTFRVSSVQLSSPA